MKSRQDLSEKSLILIVDDQPDNIFLLSMLLREYGYLVESMNSSLVALERCQQEPYPDLVLLDILMPEMDGYEFCTTLKNQGFAENIPIIFVSALDQVFDKVKAFEVGGVDYITKPFHVKEVVARIESQLKLKILQRNLQEQNRKLQKEIEERNKIEEALKVSENELRALFSAMDDLIFVLNDEGTFLKIAPTKSENLYGEVAKFIGKKIADVFAEEHTQLFLQKIRECLTLKKTINYQYCLSIHGEEHWFYCTQSPLSEDSVILIIRDISELISSEISRHLEEEKFRAAFHLSPNLLWLCTLDNGEYIDVNNAFLKVTGYSKDEVLKSPNHLLFWENPQEYERIKILLYRTRKIRNYQVNFQTKFAEIKTGLLSAEILNVNQESLVLMTLNDITERNELEQKIWETQQFLEKVIENLPVALFTKDVQNDFRFVLWNKTSEQMFGWKRQEVIGHNDYDFFSTEQADGFRQADQEVVKKAQLMEIPEEPINTLHQGTIWLRTLKLPIFNEQGEVIHLLGMAENITDKKESQARMRLLERAIAASHNGILISDATQAESPIIYVNPAFEAMTGYSASELIGKNYVLFLSQNEPEISQKLMILQRAITEEKECLVIMENHRKDGQVFWNQLSLSPVRDQGGNLTHFIGFQTDITSHKKAEQDLQESEERFRLLVNHAPVGIYQTTSNGDCVFVNPYWQEITGLTLSEALGQGWTKAIYPEDQLSVSTQWYEGTQTQKEFSMEFRFITPEGKINWVYSRAVPITKTGEITGYFGTMTEITSRKRAEQALHKQIRRAMLLGQITQEIRSSLNSQQIFQTAVTQIGKAFQVDRCVLHIYQDKTLPTIPIVAEYLPGEYRSLLNQEIPVFNNPHFLKILSEEDPVSSPNIYEEPLMPHPVQEICERFDIKSMLAIRTSYRGEINGVICLQQCQDFRSWTLDEIDLLESVGAQVGIAIAQASLLEQEKTGREELNQQNLRLQKALEERQKIDDLLEDYNKILEMIAKGMSLKDILNALIKFIENRTDARCCFALFDPTHNHLRLEAAPSLPEEYNQALAHIPIGPDIGSCGTAAYKKETVIVSDILSDDRWRDFRDLALKYDLRACWSTPILSASGDILATFAMYYSDPRTPTSEEQALLAKGTHLARVAIERHRSEENYQTIFEASYDGIVIHDPDTGSILDANQKFCEMFDFNRFELTNISLNELSFGESPYSEKEALFWIHQAKKGETQRLEWRSKTRSGRLFWSEVIFKRTILGGQERILGIMRDISDRKEVEEQLQKAALSAQVANQTKSLFLANMSHELRTPLNAILGFTQVMKRDSFLTQDQSEYLHIIGQSGEHLLSLINDILSMSKIEAGQVNFQENTFDLSDLLETLKQMLQLRAKNKGLRLEFIRDSLSPQYIVTDESKLRQILINLLGNAIKFTDKGYVILRVSTLQIPLEPPWINLSIEVEDTGVGISPEEINTLFEPFVQTESGRKSQEGTGLGLPISRQFIQLMGGELSVTSEVGKGTKFSFVIPVKVTQELSFPNSPNLGRIIGLAPDQPTYRILIVEDKLENRKLLVKLLQPLGFEVREAENGREGIILWKTWNPHLIWMDLRMPIMDGYEATKYIKSQPEGEDTIIIALTASTFEKDRDMVLQMGCHDFIGKPFQEDVLFEKLAQHLGVRYIYEEVTPTINSSAIFSSQEVDLEELSQLLKLMSPEWIEQLRQATLCCDDEEVLQLVKDYPNLDNILSERLTNWVNNFEFDKILELILMSND